MQHAALRPAPELDPGPPPEGDIENTESQCLLHHLQADEGYRTEILPDGRVRRFRPREAPRFGPAIHEAPPDAGGRGP